MLVVKTPTSSLTVYELLANKCWHRTKAKIKRRFHSGTSKVSTAPPSPISRLPQELVEKIISLFIYDFPALLAFSLTCYSWYIATVPHLHHTLTIHNLSHIPGHQWPRPLKKSYELGLLPLVKRFRICLWNSAFTPKQFNWFTLRYVYALTHLQELGIDHLQVSSFMPTIRQCFGHLSPNLRFLALKDPHGTCRQILYFIGLFQNLEDLKLQYQGPMYEPENTTDVTLIPLSTPPLRGWLRFIRITKEDFVKGMITLFGGLRFCHMDLFEVSCSQLLLNECAETLETLRLYSTDAHVKPRAPHGFDLSRNKSLRTLETTALSMNSPYPTVSSFLKAVLSSIASPAPLDVVIIYQNDDFDELGLCRLCAPGPHRPHPYYVHWAASYSEPQCHIMGYRSHFTVFREMHNVRGFRLVFCMDVPDCVIRRALGGLERVLLEEKRKGGFDYLLCGPFVTCERRMLRTGPSYPIMPLAGAMPPVCAL